MLNLLKGTGLKEFQSGTKLTSDVLNVINNRINDLVSTVNVLLMGYVNVNAEEGDLGVTYTLVSAIKKVPSERRKSGVLVTFRDGDSNGEWASYIYTGESNNDVDWNDTTKWTANLKPVIDGGEW